MQTFRIGTRFPLLSSPASLASLSTHFRFHTSLVFLSTFYAASTQLTPLEAGICRPNQYTIRHGCSYCFIYLQLTTIKYGSVDRSSLDIVRIYSKKQMCASMNLNNYSDLIYK